MAETQSAPNGRLSEKAALDGTPAATSSASSFKSTASQVAPADTPASSQSTAAGASQDEEEEAEWQPPTNGPLKTPIPKPSQSAKAPGSPKLNVEHETKYATILASVSQWETIPATTAKNAPQAPIQDHERMWLTRECLLRYLRATKWNTANALKRLQSTLSWRREYGADTFTADYISPENETGKQVLLGYDNAARPCLYLSPGKQNTKMSDRQIHHLCYMLDRTVDMMPPGQESACLLINFKGAASGTVPSVGQARAVLNILQGHNPERLGKALISELPWYVSTFFKMISPFIDPVTREKMKFNEELKLYVPKQQLWNAYAGGELDFVYEHTAYWPAFAAETDRRRAAYRERWERAGKRIGEFEEYLRGGRHACLRDVVGQKGEGGESDADLAAAGVAKLSV
ncbi:hypothetical protein LTR36_002092 [Oleoguttula mirabilis]|uniref:CRAL-TRIO domain-containing protein n=1 Tax=Oleoguttula mirabilis TaxID=1507867 RepID=A0AAV9JN89_9PEZI|nr:hypothetical protein LTR36_002092 [Oleoguttula mirabilis]